MKRLRIVVMFALLTVLGTTAVVAHGGHKLEAQMNGTSEVPGPGDADGTGFAEIKINEKKRTVKFEIDVQNIGPATLAHIHPGKTGRGKSARRHPHPAGRKGPLRRDRKGVEIANQAAPEEASELLCERP